MRGSKSLMVLSVCAGVISQGCAVNTLPSPARPMDPVRYYQLEIPDSIEVLSVDFDLAMYGQRSGGDEGRAFVKVIGKVRNSDRFVLFLFEDIDQRREPIEVIAIRSVPRPAGPR